MVEFVPERLRQMRWLVRSPREQGTSVSFAPQILHFFIYSRDKDVNVISESVKREESGTGERVVFCAFLLSLVADERGLKFILTISP